LNGGATYDVGENIRMRPALLSAATLLAALAAGPAGAAAQAGRIECRATENGEPASGTFTARSGDHTASGSCGASVSVPAGDYEVTVRLDGALDRPEQTRRVAVRAGQRADVSVDFQTGMLEVQVTSQGHRAAGMATIYDARGERIGTVGCGVRTHLSAGTYTVVVRHRSTEQRHEGVRIAAGETRTVTTEF
jgi:hypothetical protein